MSPNQQRKQRHRRRGIPLALKLIRLKFYLLQRSMPALAIRKALDLWLLTRRFKPPGREQRWAMGAKKSKCQTSVGNIQVYSWGQGPLVLLIHGWNGRGLQLGGFVAPLLERGFKIISLDLPGHGESEGTSCNILRISQALIELARQIGKPSAIIAHSFGVSGAAYALNHGLQCDLFVSISAPFSSRWLLDLYCRSIRFQPKLIPRLFDLIEQRFENGFMDSISTDNNFEKLTIPGKIVHDRDDADVPWQHAELLAQRWKKAELYPTEGLGHQRILHNSKVNADIADYIAKQLVDLQKFPDH